MNGESDIQDAIKPDIDNFRDLPGYIDEHLDEFKDKQVLMYSTAGVRTSVPLHILIKKCS